MSTQPDAVRDESVDERADRNWNELLQELRVMQTGTQILTAFLLALAFQPAFADLSGGQRMLYLALVALSALSSVAALAPVAMHRVAFRRGVKPEIVRFGHALMISALAMVSLLLTGVVGFVFDVVVGASAAVVAAVAFGAVIVGLWVLVPAMVRARAG